MSDPSEAAAIRTQAMLRELAPLHDIPFRITIEIARIRMSVHELIQLRPAQVLELKKPAGEPLDICINGNHVARGEVIVVEQTSGVRIIEVFKPGASMSGATV
jgi:flagellar motor switch protein FliN